MAGLDGGNAAVLIRNYGAAYQMYGTHTKVFQGQTSAALSFWLRYVSTPWGGNIFDENPSTVNFRIRRGLSGGNIVFLVLAKAAGDATLYEAAGTTIPVADTWYHLFVAVYGGNLYIYVDGAEEGSVALPGGIYDDGDDYIGWRVASSSVSYFEHAIEAPAIWAPMTGIADKAALDAMVADLYNAGAGKFWTLGGGWA